MEKKIIKDIVGDLDCGMKCFIHSVTKEIKVIPDTDEYADVDLEAWSDIIEEIDNHFGDYIEIEGMDSQDSFKVMEGFIDIVDNERLREKLIDALSRRKPFQNFKTVIDNSGEYRDKWFKFKENALTEWVESQLHKNGL
jgi:hypothetical protein